MHHKYMNPGWGESDWLKLISLTPPNERGGGILEAMLQSQWAWQHRSVVAICCPAANPGAALSLVISQLLRHPLRLCPLHAPTLQWRHYSAQLGLAHSPSLKPRNSFFFFNSEKFPSLFVTGSTSQACYT